MASSATRASPRANLTAPASPDRPAVEMYTPESAAPEDDEAAEEEHRLNKLRRAREAASTIRTMQKGVVTTPSAIHSVQVSIEGTALHLRI